MPGWLLEAENCHGCAVARQTSAAAPSQRVVQQPPYGLRAGRGPEAPDTCACEASAHSPAAQPAGTKRRRAARREGGKARRGAHRGAADRVLPGRRIGGPGAIAHRAARTFPCADAHDGQPSRRRIVQRDAHVARGGGDRPHQAHRRRAVPRRTRPERTGGASARSNLSCACARRTRHPRHDGASRRPLDDAPGWDALHRARGARVAITLHDNASSRGDPVRGREMQCGEGITSQSHSLSDITYREYRGVHVLYLT